jgi:PBSX family phage portal protein
MVTGTYLGNGEALGTVEAFILGDRRLVGAHALKHQAIGGAWPPSSRQLEELEKIGFGAQVVEPPFDLSKLYDWIYLNPLHGACVQQKTIDVVERGYQIARAPGLPEEAEPDEAQRLRLQAFLDAPNPEETFTDIVPKWVTDWEAVGNGYLEAIRGPNQQLAVYHMPAPTVRVRRHPEGYVQVRGGRRRYFKRYGDERAIDNRTGREAEAGLALEHVASEVLHLKLYTHLSEFYGAPQWLGALAAMLGSQKAHEFNIEFFDNRAVPAYAVLVKGGRLSKESRDYIETFFREQLKGQHHRTVVLEALPGVAGTTVQVALEPLAVEVRDASFRLFKLDNATEILVAHKMPPYRVGWAVVGSLGGATAAEMTQIYKESVVKPRQSRLEAVLNRLFRDVLQVTDWELRFQEIDVRDEVRDMELAERRVRLGAWSPNDVAEHLGKEPVPGGDERIIWINRPPRCAWRTCRRWPARAAATAPARRISGCWRAWGSNGSGRPRCGRGSA